MIERMKKFLWLVAAAVMLPSVAVAQEFTDVNEDGYELKYNVLDADSKTVEVISNDYWKLNGSLKIPATVSDGTDEYTVTEIGNSAFMGCSSLLSVILPEGLKKIGEEAFYWCTSLNTPVFPSTLEEICNSAFCFNSFKDDLRIPGNVKKIDDDAFYGSEKCNDDYSPNYYLERIIVEEGVEYIGDHAFGGYYNLKYISLPSTITHLGEYFVNGHDWELNPDDLKTIKLNFTNPDVLENGYYFVDCFSFNYEQITVYVPQGSKSAFESKFFLDYDYGIQSKQIVEMSYSAAVDPEDENSLTLDANDEYIVLEDGEPYTNEIDLTGVNVRYNRDFKTTNWQAMFVPANFAVSEMQRYGQLGELLNIRTDVEGDLSTISMVWQMVTEGSIRANYPYIFCPKATGAATFEGQGLRLRSASDLLSERFVIRTNPHTGFTRYNYVPFLLTGTYTEKTDMATCGAYALSGGVFKKADSDEKHLAPYRIYLVVNNGDELPGSASYAPIRNIIIDENGDATVIEGVLEGVEPVVRRADGLYDLQGRRVSPAAKGIVIENGQKVLRK